MVIPKLVPIQPNYPLTTYVLITESPDWRIINQASCFKSSPLGAALVWWLEATNENYPRTGAGAVDTKWDIIWYYPVGSPTSTELPTWTLGGGLYFMSNQIISSSSSPEREQLVVWLGLYVIPNKTWIIQLSQLNFYHALWTTANLGGPCWQKLCLPKPYILWILNSVPSSVINYSRKSVLNRHAY